MSIFFPYKINEVISTLENWFTLDLSTITDYQKIIITIAINTYFFIFWFFIIFCILKGMNWVYERIC